MFRKTVTGLVTMFVLALTGAGAANAASCRLPGNAAGLTQAAGSAINQYRTTKGQPALQRNAELDRIAQAHACYMAVSGKFSHRGNGGSSPRKRIRNGGYCADFSAENIALGQTSGGQVTHSWVNSSGHRRNIMARQAREYGLAVAMMNGKPAWVMVFASPC